MEILTGKALSERPVNGLHIDEPYGTLIGRPELPFSAFWWGGKGSGKSTGAMGVLRSLVRVTGYPGIYVSAEEGVRGTMTLKAQRLGADRVPGLLFASYTSVSDLKEAVTEHKIRHIVIDSVSVVDPGTLEAVTLNTWLVNRGVSVIWIAHESKDGRFKGNTKLPHEVDIEIQQYKTDADTHLARALKNRYMHDPDGLAQVEVPMTAADIDEVEEESRVQLRLADVLRRYERTGLRGPKWLTSHLDGLSMTVGAHHGPVTFDAERADGLTVVTMYISGEAVDYDAQSAMKEALRRLVLRNKHRELTALPEDARRILGKDAEVGA